VFRHTVVGSGHFHDIKEPAVSAENKLLIQARLGTAAHRPLTVPDYHPEWNALLSEVNRDVGLAAGLRTAETALMLGGWFGFGFLLGLLFLR